MSSTTMRNNSTDQADVINRPQVVANLGYRGDALNKKLMDDAFEVENLKLEVKHNACFVAGTLVHTDKGLVPIEQLKVGDLVLSKHESGEGEVAYKRVLKTFKSPEKHRIMRVGFNVPNLTNPVFNEVSAKMTDEQVLASAKFCESSDFGKYSDPYYIYCTENHPFWTEEQGWVAAHMLEEGYFDTFTTLVNHDGIPLYYTSDYTYNTPLLKTCIKDLVMLCDRRSAEPREPLDLIDFSKNHPVLIKGLDTEKYPRFSEEKSYSMNQPFIDISKDPNHPIHQELRDYGYIRTDEDPFYMEHGYTYEGIKDNKELYRILYKKYNLASDPQYYHATVYNIEVEDYHTYFVGEVGVWVHNTNCIPADELAKKPDHRERARHRPLWHKPCNSILATVHQIDCAIIVEEFNAIKIRGLAQHVK